MLKSYKADDLLLKDLDYNFIQGFDTFLRTHKPKDHHKPIGDNGIKVRLVRLKKMVHVAENLEWIDRNPFNNFKIKMKKVARDFLTDAELMAIEHHSFGVERLELIRDLFIFSCYTGLAYVDVMKLRRTQIVKAIDMWIRTSREKTLEMVNVPLLAKALAII